MFAGGKKLGYIRGGTDLFPVFYIAQKNRRTKDESQGRGQRTKILGLLLQEILIWVA